jgi:hypothetical protein
MNVQEVQGLGFDQLWGKVARSLGWDELIILWNPGCKRMMGKHPDAKKEDLDSKGRAFVPRYVDDLNVMHEVENTLTHEQDIQFYGWIAVVVERDDADKCRYAHATARQRAEAFVLTLTSKE